MAWVNLTEEEASLVIAGMTLLTVPMARRISEKLTEAFHPTDAKKVLDEKYRTAAQERYSRDGELEIDDEAVVSPGDDPGAYVMAWRWIYNSDAGIE